jgi:hypothetical protein
MSRCNDFGMAAAQSFRHEQGQNAGSVSAVPIFLHPWTSNTIAEPLENCFSWELLLAYLSS